MSVTKYFDAFPIIDYKFGDEEFVVPIENLSIYVDVVDQVRRSSATYQNYDILPGERPDQVSYKLYNTTDYYWTFFLMNDKLRERGWPLSPIKAEEFAKKEYKGKKELLNFHIVLNGWRNLRAKAVAYFILKPFCIVIKRRHKQWY